MSRNEVVSALFLSGESMDSVVGRKRHWVVFLSAGRSTWRKEKNLESSGGGPSFWRTAGTLSAYSSLYCFSKRFLHYLSLSLPGKYSEFWMPRHGNISNPLPLLLTSPKGRLPAGQQCRDLSIDFLFTEREPKGEADVHGNTRSRRRRRRKEKYTNLAKLSPWFACALDVPRLKRAASFCEVWW